MAKRRGMWGKVGPLEKGADGLYRTKDGVIIISKNHPETWYDEKDPTPKEEQWRQVEHILMVKALIVIGCFVSTFIMLAFVSC